MWSTWVIGGLSDGDHWSGEDGEARRIRARRARRRPARRRTMGRRWDRPPHRPTSGRRWAHRGPAAAGSHRAAAGATRRIEGPTSASDCGDRAGPARTPRGHPLERHAREWRQVPGRLGMGAGSAAVVRTSFDGVPRNLSPSGSATRWRAMLSSTRHRLRRRSPTAFRLELHITAGGRHTGAAAVNSGAQPEASPSRRPGGRTHVPASGTQVARRRPAAGAPQG